MRLRGRTVTAIAVAALAAACGGPAVESPDLTVYGPYVGPEADIFARSLDTFESQSGLTVEYIGSSSFQVDFADRVNSAALPDVTIIPQLALLEPLYEDGHAVPLPADVSDQLVESVGEFWAAVAAPEGEALAVPYRFVVKSLVWYRADVFTEEGYEVPETLAQLKALVRRMIDDGYAPWCAGMDSAGSTGWWATDWIEDLIVRNNGAPYYWNWALLQNPFTDGPVVSAMREFQDIISRDGAMEGGRRSILNVRVEDAIEPMFAETPGCLMHKQASFQPIWFPEGVEFGDPEVDVFALPTVQAVDPPILISGEFAVATSDRPESVQLLQYLFSEEAFEPWRDAGGSLIARAEPREGETRNELDRLLAEMVADAPSVVLDGSDMMPQQIGTDAFFLGMIDLVAGRSPSEVAAEIQEAVEALPAG